MMIINLDDDDKYINMILYACCSRLKWHTEVNTVCNTRSQLIHEDLETSELLKYS